MILPLAKTQILNMFAPLMNTLTLLTPLIMPPQLRKNGLISLLQSSNTMMNPSSVLTLTSSVRVLQQNYQT